MKESSSLYYGVPAKAITIFLYFSSFALIYLAIFETQQQLGLLVAIVFFVFSFFLILSVYEVFFTSYFYDGHKIVVTRLWRKKKIVEWKNTIDILESNYACCYTIISKDNSKIRFSYFLSGIEEFVDSAEKNINFINDAAIE